MTVRLLHGTSAAAAELAARRGAWLPQDPAAVADRVGRSLGLNPEQILQHTCMAQSADRARDRYLYLTGAERTAVTYAQLGSEMLSDALTAAYQLLHPDPADSDDLPSGQARVRMRRRRVEQSAWAQAWRERHGVRPAVVEFELDEQAVASSYQYRSYREAADPERVAGPAQWLSWCTDGGADAVGCLMLPCPVTVPWTDVTGPVLRGRENADGAVAA